ncbi:MAG: hypothetical protein MSC50_00790 [Campylobacter sp.]|nr:hypothetical protein [Campylobacter sp.]MCI6578811.1 hypothetical protein [Campylobacter sp.]MCI7013858.1 hypothetical protein [Campylobacter sp.]
MTQGLGILEFLGLKLNWLSLPGGAWLSLRCVAFYYRKPKGQRKFRIP